MIPFSFQFITQLTCYPINQRVEPISINTLKLQRSLQCFETIFKRDNDEILYSKEIFIKMGCTFNEEDVYNALRNDKLNTFHEFIRQGLNVDLVFTATKDRSAHGKTLLQFVLSCYPNPDDPLLCYLLQDAKCDVNKAAKVVSSKNGIARVKTIKHRDRLQGTCLYTALCRQDTELIRLLVKWGADVNLYDSQLCSALWHAVDTQNEDIVDIILSVDDVDINIPDRHHISPLHVAALHGNAALVTKLIRYGAVIDVQNMKQMTPLNVACHKRQTCEVVHALLQHGANPNARSSDGITPLRGALTKQHFEPDIVLLLLAAGADVINAVRYMSRTLAFTRTLVENPLILELLLSNMASPRSLKILTAVKIRNVLIIKTRGRSIYDQFNSLPLPKLLIQFLKLDLIY